MNLSSSFQAVFLSASETVAIIITRNGQKQRRRRRQFKDAHGALAGCIKHKAGFVYTPEEPTPFLN